MQSNEGSANSGALLCVDDVRVSFRGRRHSTLQAVDGVSFGIKSGETLALVGESGCGKSTLGRSIVRLQNIDSGEIRLNGTEISRLTERQLLPFRRSMQMVFQDAYSSLDPRMSVREIIAEPINALGISPKLGTDERITELMEMVGLDPKLSNRRPASFSGGQRQRIGIARALAAEPELIVADEPVSALDASVQNQILNILAHSKRTQGLAYLFISHDMRAVRFLADRVAVMYLGRIVETASVDEIFDAPKHPYTKALMTANDRSSGAGEGTRITGEVNTGSTPTTGCSFRDRCPLAVDDCAVIKPELLPKTAGHYAACIRI